jgi:hypothetical protein
MVQLTTEQRVFVVTQFTLLQNVTAVQNAFRIRFPGRNSPVRNTILKNVRKYQNTGTSLNRNKSNSGRRRTVRNEANIAAVRELLEETPRGLSVRRNPVAVSKSSFNRITRLDIYDGIPTECTYVTSYVLMTCHVDYAIQIGLTNAVETQIFCKALLSEMKQDLSWIEKLTLIMCASMHRKEIHRHAKLTIWAALCGNGVIVGP